MPFAIIAINITLVKNKQNIGFDTLFHIFSNFFGDDQGFELSKTE